MQEHKADLVVEFVDFLSVIEIAVSDNMDTRPKSGKTLFISLQFIPEACRCTGRLEMMSELRIKRN